VRLPGEGGRRRAVASGGARVRADTRGGGRVMEAAREGARVGQPTTMWMAEWVGEDGDRVGKRQGVGG
jgi:hypothetical protein